MFLSSYRKIHCVALLLTSASRGHIGLRKWENLTHLRVKSPRWEPILGKDNSSNQPPLTMWFWTSLTASTMYLLLGLEGILKLSSPNLLRQPYLGAWATLASHFHRAHSRSSPLPTFSPLCTNCIPQAPLTANGSTPMASISLLPFSHLGCNY